MNSTKTNNYSNVYKKNDKNLKVQEGGGPNQKGKSVPVMNRKEAHENGDIKNIYNCDKMEKYMGTKFQVSIDCTGCGIFKSREKGL